ncbi:MAG: hypothetical protein JWM85_2229 [Acidimicrobiaceae bacterium]|nr:hypothetical protein [Acidimicrobiaceae bacterium]
MTVTPTASDGPDVQGGLSRSSMSSGSMTQPVTHPYPRNSQTQGGLIRRQTPRNSQAPEGRGAGKNFGGSAPLTPAVINFPPRSATGSSDWSNRHVCPGCGAKLPDATGKRGRPPKFCGKKCRYAHRDRQRHIPAGTVVERACRDCERPFRYVSVTTPRLRCDECKTGSRPRARADERSLTCDECGLAFTTGKPAQRFCSAKCRYDSKNKRRGQR